MRKVIFGVLVILLFTILISDRFFASKLGFVSFLNRLTPAEESARMAELEKENQNLKLQLLNQKTRKVHTFKVYSAYPFSNRGEISIAAGSRDGIKTGDVVTYGEGILVGKVIKVSESISIVKTIFDPSWRSTVRIGEAEIDALFEGGNEPSVTLVPPEAEIKDGELVITASDDLPYGLGMGTLTNIRTAPGNAYKEATLEPSFQLKNLKDVSIYR